MRSLAGKIVGAYGLAQIRPSARTPVINEARLTHVRLKTLCFGEMSLAGMGYSTPSNQCWPGGVPYVFWDFAMEILQERDQITMVYRTGNEVRRVRLNEPHPVVVTPSWYGDSIGRYEGDTLVIDTVGRSISSDRISHCSAIFA